MIAFVLTLLYISISLLTPESLPEVLQDIHILEIIFALTVIASVPNLKRSGLVALKDTWFVTALICAAFLSILMTGWIGGAFSMTQGLLTTVTAYFFVTVNCTTMPRLKILAAVLAAICVDILIHGMIAAHSGVDQSPYFMHERELVRYRGMGMINDPNDLAQVLVAAIGLLWLRWRKGKLTANLFLTILPAVFLCYGVYLTHSRGGLIALIAMTLYGFKDRLGLVRSAILTGLLGVALVAFNASGGRNINDDDGDRIGLWSAALSTFKTHPITGVGMYRFGDYSGNGLTAHNSYVLCLAELGLFGYVCWMGAIVTSWSGLGAIAARRITAEPATAGPALKAVRVVRGPVQPQARKPVPPQPARAAVPRLPRNQPSLAEGEAAREAELAPIRSASHVVRSAMVGVLVSAFFISRTYATILYVVFGISAALRMIHQHAAGEKAPEIPLFKRVSLATFASITFIYLFVRFRGSH